MCLRMSICMYLCVDGDLHACLCVEGDLHACVWVVYILRVFEYPRCPSLLLNHLVHLHLVFFLCFRC